MRRNTDATWHGDMFDGLGFVAAMRAKGCEPQGQQCLLVGAGGAGSAIAHALVMAGASRVAIHDDDLVRRTTLVTKLASLGTCPVSAGTGDPTGFDIVLNATPMGMKATDPMPVDIDKLSAAMFVGCVITAPAVSPLIEAARAKGCATMTGADMFAGVSTLMVDFLLNS
jgi:shikimate dehydrogenase